jgi:transcriptional regulator with GAF, ATPase, and Fis domain
VRLLRREYAALARATLSGVPTELGFRSAAGSGAILTQERISAMPWGEALATRGVRELLGGLSDVAGLLAFLHGQGLVHGDISPGNLLLGVDSGSGDAVAVRGWLLDFGFLGVAGRPRPGPPLCGTPLLLAPELLRGETPTPRSDIYAFACLLLAVLDGRMTPALDLPGATTAPTIAGDPAAESRERSSAHDSPAAARAAELRPDHPRLRPLDAVAELLSLLCAALDPNPAHRPTAWRLQCVLLKALAEPPPAAAEHFGGWLADCIFPEIEARIRHGLRALRHGMSRVLLLSGAAGSGRSSLLRYARILATAAGVPVTHLGSEPQNAPALLLIDGDQLPVGMPSPRADAATGDSAAIRAIEDALAAGGPQLVIAAMGAAPPLRPPSPAPRRETGDTPGWEFLPLQPLADAANARLACALLGQQVLPGELLHTLRSAGCDRPASVREALHALLAAGALRRDRDGALHYWPGIALSVLPLSSTEIPVGATDRAAAATPAAAPAPLTVLRLCNQLLDQGAPQTAARQLLRLLRRPSIAPCDHLAALSIALRALAHCGRPRLARRLLRRQRRRLDPTPANRRAFALMALQAASRQQDAQQGAIEADTLLEQIPERTATPTESLELARHFQLRGDLARARQWALGAERASTSPKATVADDGLPRSPAASANIKAAAFDHSPPRALRARVLNLLGMLDFAAGDHGAARRRLTHAAELRRTAGLHGPLAASLMNLAALDQAEGKLKLARAHLDAALALRRATSDWSGIADLHEHLGRLEARRGADQAALLQFRQTLQMRRRARDLRGVAAAAHNCGIIETRLGNPHLGRHLATEAQQRFSTLGDHAAAHRAQLHAALADAQCGFPHRALDTLGRLSRALRTRPAAERVSLTWQRASLLLECGRVHAARRLAAWVAHHTRQGAPDRRAAALDLWARAALAAGDRATAEQAAQALGALRTAGDPLIRLRADLLRIALTRPGAPDRPTISGEFAASPSEADLHALPAPADLLRLAQRVGGALPIPTAIATVNALLAAGRPELARALRSLPELSASCRRAIEAGLAAARQPSAHAAHPPQLPSLLSVTAPEQIGALLKVGRLLSSISSPQQLFRDILQLLLEEIDGERAILTLRRGQSTEFEIAHARNATPAVADDACRISRTIVRRAYREHRLLHSSNALKDAEFAGLRSVQLHQIVAFACVPMTVAGRIIGTIYIDHAVTARAFDDRALAFLEAFAAIAATAVEHARLHAQLSDRAAGLERGVEALHGLSSLIQRSRPMRRLMAEARRFATVAEAPILILGETGTGKSLLAAAIHYSGPRSAGPLVTIDCGTLQPQLAASELFGHVRGAFTGASRNHAGAFERADGGTLLLDEVGNLPPAVQSQLLRVLQTRQLRRLGATQSRRFDLRLICATNRDLSAAVSAGNFRRDLYYRIQTLPLEIPPLRTRRGDILPLTDRFLTQLAAHLKRPRPTLSADLRQRLLDAEWPGNARQLHNLLHRMMVLLPAAHWSETDLPADFFLRGKDGTPLASGGRTGPIAAAEAPRPTLREVEQDLLITALETHRWNRTAAARQLGLTLRQIRHRIKKFGIEIPPHARRRHPRSSAS